MLLSEHLRSQYVEKSTNFTHCWFIRESLLLRSLFGTPRRWLRASYESGTRISKEEHVTRVLGRVLKPL